MNSLGNSKVWKERLNKIDTDIEEIRIPQLNPKEYSISQDEEWLEVRTRGHLKRIRFHDYGELYKIPGLYEKLFYERLKCCSPSVAN